MLLKALYGLKQAPLLQYNEFVRFIKKHSFNPFLFNACIFRNEARIIIVVYVDDILIIARLVASIFNVAKLIDRTFKLRLLSKLHYYLGIRIIRDRLRRQLIVVQDAYIDKIATKFNLIGLYPTSLGTLLGKALAIQLRVPLDDYSATNKLKIEYQTLVSSGVQLVCITRPDCSYKVRLLYRFLRNPTIAYRNAALYVLRYIISTKNRGLLFQGGNGFILTSYTNSLQADNTNTRRSTSGIVFTLAGVLVLFKLGRQTIVILLSTKAEYI